MTTPTPYDVFTDLYRVNGDDEFDMSREECQKLIDELPTYLTPQEIEEWNRETEPDMLDLSLDLQGLVQDKTGAVLRKPDHASCAYLSRLVGDTSPPQRVTQRWLKLAEFLGMSNNPEDDSDRTLCASALHLALYSQEIEKGSEAYNHLFDKQVIDALAGFLSNRNRGRPGKEALPDLLHQVEKIWYRGPREDLHPVTETGRWQRPHSVAGAAYEIVPSTFEHFMVKGILEWRTRLDPKWRLSTVINLALPPRQRIAPMAIHYDFDNPPTVIRDPQRKDRKAGPINWSKSADSQRWLVAQLVERGGANFHPPEAKAQLLSDKLGTSLEELQTRLRFLSLVQRLKKDRLPKLERRGQGTATSQIKWTKEVDNWLILRTKEDIDLRVLEAVLGVSIKNLSLRVKSLQVGDKKSAPTTAASGKPSTASRGKSRAKTTRAAKAVAQKPSKVAAASERLESQESGSEESEPDESESESAETPDLGSDREDDDMDTDGGAVLEKEPAPQRRQSLSRTGKAAGVAKTADLLSRYVVEEVEDEEEDEGEDEEEDEEEERRASARGKSKARAKAKGKGKSKARAKAKGKGK